MRGEENFQLGFFFERKKFQGFKILIGFLVALRSHLAHVHLDSDGSREYTGGNEGNARICGAVTGFQAPLWFRLCSSARGTQRQEDTWPSL